MSLVAESVGLSLGGRELLREVSISIEPGQVHVVLGPNGAGKSSLLRLLSGELQPGAGRIALNGKALADCSPAFQARHRAVLPQSESLGFAFAVEEVVALGRLPSPRHAPGREAGIVREALALTDTGHLLGRRYTTLSGGERRRVQLSRVLAQIWEPVDSGPRFLLLDEPTASLDLAHQHQSLRLARQFAGNGVGVLAVLHDPNLALAYGDRATVLCCGERVASGTPREVLTAETMQRVFGVRARILEDEGARYISVLGS
ncbi:MAG TPA: heme ABC transporter ATP-binding protein [Solimonas sp.]|nr:heme ABC transporter ATP-binding protein [Solimonas sp.]